MQWRELLVPGWADLHIRSQHLWPDELLDRLHRSQRVQRHLRRFVQRQLRGQLELRDHARSERQRVVHGQFDVPHRLHGHVLSELLFRIDV